MTCSSFREALSAQLDGEPGGIAQRWVDEHLAGCAACRVWQEAAAEVTRRARLAPVPVVPDVTRAVLERLPQAAARESGRRRVWVSSALRLGLLAVGGGQLALALPPLVAGAATMSAPVHVAHESGAWNLAVAIAFFVVGVFPRLAAGALPMLGSFTVVLWWVTLDDLGAGHVYSHRALGHLLLLTGVLLVAALAWRGRRRTGALAAARRRGRQLRPGARSDLSTHRVRP